jgi:peptidoglycan/xylan/chitin deacetylase (PgdA/CDA1 family)
MEYPKGHPINGSLHVLILAYHRVNPEVRDGLSVSPETLRSHIETLTRRGLECVVLDEVVGSDPVDLSSRAFALTFDDGYQDNFFHARPVLEDLGVRATVYLVSSMIDANHPFPWLKLSNPTDFDEMDLHMTGEQIETAADTFTYGSHTLTHPMLSTLGVDAAREEIEGSKRAIETRFGIDVTTFCYPAGDFNEATVELVRETGYRAAVVTPNRYIPESMHTLHRIGIYSHITPTLFAVKTSRALRIAQRSRAFWAFRHRLLRR